MPDFDPFWDLDMDVLDPYDARMERVFARYRSLRKVFVLLLAMDVCLMAILLVFSLAHARSTPTPTTPPSPSPSLPPPPPTPPHGVPQPPPPPSPPHQVTPSYSSSPLLSSYGIVEILGYLLIDAVGASASNQENRDRYVVFIILMLISSLVMLSMHGMGFLFLIRLPILYLAAQIRTALHRLDLLHSHMDASPTAPSPRRILVAPVVGQQQMAPRDIERIRLLTQLFSGRPPPIAINDTSPSPRRSDQPDSDDPFDDYGMLAGP